MVPGPIRERRACARGKAEENRRSFDARLDEVRSRAGNAKQWLREADGSLAPNEKLFVLLEAVKETCKTKKLAGDLFVRLRDHNDLPRRRGGGPRCESPLDDRRWDEKTIARWLGFRAASPTPADAALLIKHLSEIVQETLEKCGRSRQPRVADVVAHPGDDPFVCLQRVRGSLGLAKREEYVPSPSHNSVIGESFDDAPKDVDPEPEGERLIGEYAEEAMRRLADPSEQVRLVVVKAPVSSGRKLVLQRFVSEHLDADRRFRLAGGRGKLPVFACALDETSPDQLIDQLYSFYSPVLGLNALVGLPLETKLALVRGICAKFPACVIISDLSRTEEYAGIVFDYLLKAHPLTRILITTDEDETLDDLAATSVACHTLRPSQDVLLFEPSHLLGDSGSRVTRLCRRLARAAFQLISERRQNPHPLYHMLHDRASKNDYAGIVELVWEELRSEERIVVGLIACSPVGLTLAALQTMLASFRARGDLEQTALRRSTEVLALIKTLRQLVQVRGPSAARVLTRSGTLLFLDDGWRRLFHETFFVRNRAAARFASWLVARDAAAHCRAVRLEGWRSAFPSEDAESTARAVIALLASIDIDTVQPFHTRQDDGDTLYEAKVLPPPEDVRARQPSATVVLRYAFLQILRSERQAHPRSGNAFLDVPRRYLRVLLAFAAPSEPWRKTDAIVIRPERGAYRHLEDAFTLEETVCLLDQTSEAAFRARRFEVVSAAARVMERRLEEASRDYPESRPPISLCWPVWRREIESALLLGRTPSPAPGDPRGPDALQISGVVAAIEKLLDGPFGGAAAKDDFEIERARGMLFGLLGEACTLAGRREEAEVAFDRGMQIVKSQRRRLPLAVAPQPILGERFSRSRMRFLMGVVTSRHRADFSPEGRFPDGFTMSLPALVPEDTDMLVRARDILSVRVRRMSSLDYSERVRCRIDEARLLAARYEYGRAMSLLEESDFPRIGVVAEEALEWMAMRVRMLVNAAFVMAAPPRAPDANLRKKLIALEKLAPGAQGRTEVAAALLSRARAEIARFAQFVRKPQNGDSEFTPYWIYVQLMLAWCQFLTSRIAPAAEAAAALKDACETLSRIDSRMQGMGIRYHAAEVEYLAATVKCWTARRTL